MDRFISNIPAAISQCAKDLTSSDTLTLEAQSRAYDLSCPVFLQMV